jgi:hypothetical protein
MTRNPVPCRYVVYGLFQRVEGATTAIIFVQHYSHLNSHYSMVCGKELKAVGPAPPLTLASADGQWHACYCASQYHPMWRESEARPKSQEHNILGILQQILCVLILLWSIGADHDVIKPVINRVNEAAARMTISETNEKCFTYRPVSLGCHLLCSWQFYKYASKRLSCLSEEWRGHRSSFKMNLRKAASLAFSNTGGFLKR